jgi:hypothetical protein
MPLPGLGAEEPPDGEAHPPASQPHAKDNTSGEATAFTEWKVFMLVPLLLIFTLWEM